MGFALPGPTPAQSMFRAIGDPAGNGKPGGGVHADLRQPASADQDAAAARLDPRGLIHPRSSPTFWVAFFAGGFLWLNYRARR